MQFFPLFHEDTKPNYFKFLFCFINSISLYVGRFFPFFCLSIFFKTMTFLKLWWFFIVYPFFFAIDFSTNHQNGSFVLWLPKLHMLFLDIVLVWSTESPPLCLNVWRHILQCVLSLPPCPKTISYFHMLTSLGNLI